MKIKRICSVMILCIVAVCACLASGCAYSGVSKAQGVWKMVKKDDGSVAAYAFTSAEIVVEKTRMKVSFSYSDVCESFDIQSGVYNIISYDCRDDEVSLDMDMGGHDYFRARVFDGKLVIDNVHVEFKTDVGEYEAGRYHMCEIEFSKEPGKPDVDTAFQDVKESYYRAGYQTDLSGDHVDSSMAAAISAMRAAYAQFGYTMDFIGKNLDDITKAEIYMLIDAGSTKEAKKFASELDGTYKNAQNGSLVIVFIFGIVEPDFTPFNMM